MASPRKPIPSSFGPRNLDALLPPAKGYHYFQDGKDFPFDRAARGHSPVNAWWLAECALLAYETEKNIRSALESAKVFDLASFHPWKEPQTGLDGFAVQSGDYAILSFRGTEFYRLCDLLAAFGKLASMGRDIGQDAKLWLSAQAGPPRFDVPVVHGFYQSLQSVWPELQAWIAALPPSRSLWLTGHSLGGALAVLLAFQFPQHVAGVYTFGCPCPGGRPFADACRHMELVDKTFRYVHGNDLVAKGLEFPFTPYRHVGTPIILEAESRRNWWERAWNRLVPREPTDHAPLYYALHTWNRIP